MTLAHTQTEKIVYIQNKIKIKPNKNMNFLKYKTTRIKIDLIQFLRLYQFSKNCAPQKVSKGKQYHISQPKLTKFVNIQKIMPFLPYPSEQDAQE